MVFYTENYHKTLGGTLRDSGADLSTVDIKPRFKGLLWWLHLFGTVWKCNWIQKPWYHGKDWLNPKADNMAHRSESSNQKHRIRVKDIWTQKVWFRGEGWKFNWIQKSKVRYYGKVWKDNLFKNGFYMDGKYFCFSWIIWL